MQALVYHAYGDIDQLRLEDVAEPAMPQSGEIKVHVRASSINPVDAKVRRGELKLIAGHHFPKRPGLDFSGVVEAIGDGVDGIAVGDAVFGAARSMSDGAFAEHIIVRAKQVAKKPQTLDHPTAAAVVTVGIAALQSLRDIVKLQRGDNLLVYGCTGGVGLFALQIAKRTGARVTGVCSSSGVALAQAFGADDVIDYTRGAVWDGAARFRSILELSGKLSFDSAQPMLDDPGVFVDFSPTPAALIGNAITNVFRHRKHAFAMTSATTADLNWLAELIDAGELRPAPTRVYPMSAYTDAFSAAERGGSAGKIAVEITAGD